MGDDTMSEWIMVHPWMTFFLVLVIITAIAQSICNICKVILVWIERRWPEPPESEESK